MHSLNLRLHRKSLNREYELNMLTQGDFDERVFLHHNASEEIGTPTRQPMGTSTYQLMVTITTVFLVWYLPAHGNHNNGS